MHAMPIMPETVVFPERTISGAGKVFNLVPECARFGSRGVVMHGRSLARSGLLEKILACPPKDTALAAWEHGGGEPTLEDLERALACARKHKAEWIAGVGGGSVLDIAKAAAALFNCAGKLSACHDGAPIEKPGLPFIAAPSTAGTGTEATINSVLTNTATRQKKSIRDPVLIARTVILDPVLLESCPKQTVAHAGLDALTQAIEAYTSRMATGLSDLLGLEAISLIAANLEPVYDGRDENGKDRNFNKVGPDCQSGRPNCTKLAGQARLRSEASPRRAVPPYQMANLDGSAELNLLTGSYLAGLAFSMARLGVVHGLAHPLGVRHHAAHGLVCGLCLPHAVELNREAMGKKYEIMSNTIGADLLAFIRGLLKAFEIQSPFAGKEIIDKETVIRETLKSWSTAANPKPVTGADVEFLLKRLFEE